MRIQERRESIFQLYEALLMKFQFCITCQILTADGQTRFFLVVDAKATKVWLFSICISGALLEKYLFFVKV